MLFASAVRTAPDKVLWQITLVFSSYIHSKEKNRIQMFNKSKERKIK